MARIIAVANQKGGTGKTSIVVNLGACLGLVGMQVLIIDLDSQRHATFWLGFEDNEVEKSTYDVFMDKATLVSDIIQKTKFDNTYIAPSSPRLAHAELTMSNMGRREYVLLDKTQGLEQKFDYILIDCPPSLGLLFINAMAYANEVFIPLDASDFLSMEGLSRLLENVKRIQENIHVGLNVSGIILNKFDFRLNLTQEIQKTLKEHPELANRLFKSVIRRNIKVAESVSFGLPIVFYDERCHGAEDFKNLASEVMKK